MSYLAIFTVRVVPLGVAVSVLVLGWNSVLLRVLGLLLVAAAAWWALPLLAAVPGFGRFGVHVGTARWATGLYPKVRRQLSQRGEPSHADVLRSMIVLRYRLEPTNHSRERLLATIRDTTGLFELVLLVLGEEAALWGNDPPHFTRLVRDVAAAIKRSALSREVLWGDCPPADAVDFARKLRYRLVEALI